MRLLSITLVSVLLIISNLSFSANKFEMNDNCINAYRNIINLKFENSKAIIIKEKTSNPQNLIPIYLENFTDFLRIAINENAQDFKSSEKLKSKRLDLLENGDPSSPYYLYTQAEVELQWALIHIKFQSYLTSAIEINKAYTLLEKNQILFPDFSLNKKGLGVLHAIIGTIPDKYKWISKIAGFDGTVKQGIYELSYLFLNSYKQPKSRYLLPESLFYLNFVTSSLSNDESELNTLCKWQEKLDTIKSPLYLFSKINLLKKRGENDKIIGLLQNREKSAEQFQFHYLTYLLGEAKLFKLDCSAIHELENYILNFKGQNYFKSAWLRIAWAHLINGDIDKYKQAISIIPKTGNLIVEEDKYAENEAKKTSIPNITLLKARLLFDGGYYSRSLNVLLEKEPSKFATTIKDVSEFYYRLARVYDKTGKTTEALKFYQLTIDKSSGFYEYFIPNSALQMGLIYEKIGNKEKAKEFFNKSLKMPDCDYKSGIEIKAKAGLLRVK